MTTKYDRIGIGYASRRRPDARIAAHIASALGTARSVLNVGAGTGSYEPLGAFALERSRVMIDQRSPDRAPCVQGSATHLPFRSNSVDAALSVLSLHHWDDPGAGLREMQRVAERRVVLLTWDPAVSRFWLVKDYVPEIDAIDQEIFPGMTELEAVLGPCQIRAVPIPHDCCDGFLGAYWRRPEAYLDRSVRRSISTFARIEHVDESMNHLREDLESGVWTERYGSLRDLEELDLGYRLVIADATRVSTGPK
tara:strand:- start:46 stop:801 length:756 start_codon:yes stop_codon:yes gene_type:complete